jgi:triosephosphate isomerase
VTSENAKAFLEQQSIAGLLIGKASLEPQEFIKIVQLA